MPPPPTFSSSLISDVGEDYDEASDKQVHCGPVFHSSLKASPYPTMMALLGVEKQEEKRRHLREAVKKLLKASYHC